MPIEDAAQAVERLHAMRALSSLPACPAGITLSTAWLLPNCAPRCVPGPRPCGSTREVCPPLTFRYVWYQTPGHARVLHLPPMRPGALGAQRDTSLPRRRGLCPAPHWRARLARLAPLMPSPGSACDGTQLWPAGRARRHGMPSLPEQHTSASSRAGRPPWRRSARARGPEHASAPAKRSCIFWLVQRPCGSQSTRKRRQKIHSRWGPATFSRRRNQWLLCAAPAGPGTPAAVATSGPRAASALNV